MAFSYAGTGGPVHVVRLCHMYLLCMEDQGIHMITHPHTQIMKRIPLNKLKPHKRCVSFGQQHSPSHIEFHPDAFVYSI